MAADAPPGEERGPYPGGAPRRFPRVDGTVRRARRRRGRRPPPGEHPRGVRGPRARRRSWRSPFGRAPRPTALRSRPPSGRSSWNGPTCPRATWVSRGGGSASAAAAAAAVAVVGVAAAQNALPASAQRFVSSAADLVGIHVPHPDDDDGAPSVTTVDGPRVDLGRRRGPWRRRDDPRRPGHHGLRGARRRDDGRHPWAVLDGWAARRDPRRGHAGRSRHARRPRAGDARDPASEQQRRRQRQQRPAATARANGQGQGQGQGQGNAAAGGTAQGERKGNGAAVDEG